MLNLINNLLSWIKIHPEYALLFTFFMAFGESLAFIGGFLPGTMAIVGMGVLAGTGLISIPLNLGVAVIGAVCGDVTSFWVGHYYQNEFKNLFFFRKYPKILTYGEAFFEKHGGLSVFLGRFLSPIRAIIPAIAGMMRMRFTHFFIANVLSAFGWCGLYFLSGVLVGMGHQHLPLETRQLIIGIAIVLFIPFLLLHLPRSLKKLCGKWFGKSLEHVWDMLRQQSVFFSWLTPSNHIFTYFDSAYEIIFTCFITILCIPQIPLPQFLNKIWPYFQPEIYVHILNSTQFPHLFIIMTLLIMICISARSIPWLLAAAITLSTIALFSILVKSAPMLWMMSIALQWLLCRLLLVYKNRFYYPLLMLITATWFSSTLILSLHSHTPYFRYFGLSIIAGQLGWMYARKHIQHQRWMNFFLLALALESVMVLAF